MTRLFFMELNFLDLGPFDRTQPRLTPEGTRADVYGVIRRVEMPAGGTALLHDAGLGGAEPSGSAGGEQLRPDCLRLVRWAAPS